MERERRRREGGREEGRYKNCAGGQKQANVARPTTNEEEREKNCSPAEEEKARNEGNEDNQETRWVQMGNLRR